MKNSNSFSSFMVVIIVAILFATNPSYTAHKRGISDEFKYEYGLFGRVGGKVVGEMTTYNDYILFSTTTTPKGEVVSLGVFNKVFVASTSSHRGL